MHLYAVRINGGASHSQWPRLYSNLMSVNAKQLDYTGHWGNCAVKHHIDAETLHGMLTHKIRSKKSVTIEEVTRDTIDKEHVIYADIYERLYKPYDQFENLD